MIAILMPCVNSDNIVDRALFHLSQQTKKDQIIIYMINDCSNKTKDNYQSLIQKYSDLNIKYYQTEKNSGPAYSRNLGLTKIKESYVLFHDDDDWLYDKYVIEKYLRYIKENNNKYLNKIVEIKMSYIEQIDEIQDFCLAKNHFALTGPIFSTDFLNKYNIIFNKDLKWRFEDLAFTQDVLYYATINKYQIINLNDDISYIHYHSINHNSLCCRLQLNDEEFLKTKPMNITIFYHPIFFANRVNFYKSQEYLDKFEKQQVLNILKYFYINCEIIFSLLENYSNFNNTFDDNELKVFYKSVIFLIDLIDKNFSLIKEQSKFIDIGEDFQIIRYNIFKNTFKNRFLKLTNKDIINE